MSAVFIDADIYYVQRPGYASALIEKCLDHTGKVVTTAQRLGVSRQYLNLLRNRDRLPSYPMQVSLELLASDNAELRLIVDANKYFCQQHKWISSQIDSAADACGGIVELARRIGVAKQYLNAIQDNRRRHRYPLQVALAAVQQG